MAANLGLNGVALVFGCATGIGRALLFALAHHGVTQFALGDIQDEVLAATIEDVKKAYSNLAIKQYHIDTNEEATIIAATAQIVKDFGRIDYAVNNVGISGPIAKTETIATADFRKTIDVNMTGLWISQREQIKQMLKQEPLPSIYNLKRARNKGCIVNTASMYGLIAGANCTAYNASKFAIVGLTKADAHTYASEGIRINCICPGFIATPMVVGKDGASKTPEAHLDVLANGASLKRLGEADEIADGIVFLLSEMASFMSGTPLLVDGGFSSV